MGGIGSSTYRKYDQISIETEFSTNRFRKHYNWGLLLDAVKQPPPDIQECQVYFFLLRNIIVVG